VYSVQLVDKVFLHYSEEVLANMAQDYLDVFKSANDFKSSSRTYSKVFQAEMVGGGVCVRTDSGGGVKLDFSRASIQGWAAQQVYEAETLVYELSKRKKRRGIVFDQDVHLLHHLEGEIDHFLGKYAVPAPLSTSDLIFNAQEMCRALKIGG
jgi:hypothetical protein